VAEQVLRVQVANDRQVTAIVTRPPDCRPGATPGLVLAHGMQNDLTHPLLAAVADRLAESGVATVLRFNFPYTERGVRSPDRPEVLEDALRRAHDVLVDDAVCPPRAVFLGGKSLGARVAAELVSRHHEGEGLLAAGLVFLGYPLHAPGEKDRLRTAPLRRIDCPSLFIQGSRDPFCALDLLEPIVSGLDRPGELYVVEGGGHSYEMRGKGAEPPAEVYRRVAERVAAFIRAHAQEA